MSLSNIQDDAYCTTEEWASLLPAQYRCISVASWIAKGNRGTWAKSIKILGERSPAYWLKTEILAHFSEKFGVVHPDAVAALRASPAFREMPEASIQNNATNEGHCS